jgi:cyclophilin family peptidyl-prolyl cis-trans isomerase
VERLARHRWARSGPAGLLALLWIGCQAAPSSVGIEQSPLFGEIAELEDARNPSDGALLRFMRHPDPDLRVRAATALGRMPFPEHGDEVTDALLGGLEDGDANARAEAAFALGLRGDPRAGPALVQLAVHRTRRDRIAAVRARATEAASKLALPEQRLELLRALRDESSAVRLEAVEGTHRWPRDEPTAAEVDRLLLEHLGFEGEQDVLAMTLFSLGRRKTPEALEVFLEGAVSRQPIERLWSVRGLAELEPDERSLRVLVMATRDADWRVAYEATAALGAYHLGEQAGTLLAAAEHLNPHVRRASWEALARRFAHVSDPSELAHAKAWKVAFDERTPESDPSLSVRAAFGAALVLHGRLAGHPPPSPEEVAERLREGTVSTEEWIAFAAALAQDLPAVGPPGPETLEVLELLAKEPDLRIAGAALTAIGDLRDENARGFLHAALENPDNGLRLAAVLALRGMASAADLEPLAAAYRTSSGDVGPEVRFNALRNLGAIEGERATEVLREAAHDADAYVRRVAAEELARRSEPLPPAPAPSEPDAAGTPAAGPGQELPLYRRNPRVRVSTTRGDMVFELFPREAPIHVHNFLTLAERGRYAGTLFHRVVPDFVIQGGDYRGDGNGGTTYRGEDALRHEIGPRKFVRGSLGMPRNEDPDSGGSQFFVTHRPTPHLDGRYTIFGELRAGFEVLDAIEVGDRIVEVKRVARR